MVLQQPPPGYLLISSATPLRSRLGSTGSRFNCFSSCTARSSRNTPVQHRQTLGAFLGGVQAPAHSPCLQLKQSLPQRLEEYQLKRRQQSLQCSGSAHSPAHRWLPWRPLTALLPSSPRASRRSSRPTRSSRLPGCSNSGAQEHNSSSRHSNTETTLKP